MRVAQDSDSLVNRTRATTKLMVDIDRWVMLTNKSKVWGAPHSVDPSHHTSVRLQEDFLIARDGASNLREFQSWWK